MISYKIKMNPGKEKVISCKIKQLSANNIDKA